MKSIDIQEKLLEKYKMELFEQLIQMVWNDDIESIDNLPKKVQENNKNQKIEEKILINLIRIIMGLDPIKENKKTLKEMVREANDLSVFCEPIIPIISDACKYCSENNKNETCFIKMKHINCNDKHRCSACGSCISKCRLGAISDKIQFMPIIKLLKNNNIPVYAIVAPSFIGQFGKDVTPGKLRSSFKKIGFKDMIEVSLAADILTAKEAYEYCSHIESNNNYFVTSCCCPVWLSLIKNKFPEILSKVSPSVSPMVACGRLVKMLEPESKVVFIGPCTAKKKEATLEDVKDAVDFVLTYKEVEIIFKSLKLDLNSMEDDERFEASYSGRIYGRSGGVSKAIEINAKKINPNIIFKKAVFQGIEECTTGLEDLKDSKLDATFIEGMGCIGGCVGGPKKIIGVDEGTKYTDQYSESTNIITPFDNLNVTQLLALMGLKKLEAIGEEEEKILKIFSRDTHK